MTARALADFFDRVTVLERDHREDQSETRKSIPPGNHYHVLLLGGQQVLSSLYPGFAERLNQLGAVSYRVGKDAVWYRPDGKSYLAGAMLRDPYDLGWKTHGQSRGLLERCIRQSTLAVNNINIESGVSANASRRVNFPIPAIP